MNVIHKLAELYLMKGGREDMGKGRSKGKEEEGEGKEQGRNGGRLILREHTS